MKKGKKTEKAVVQKANKREARKVAKVFRDEFNMLRNTILGDLKVRIVRLEAYAKQTQPTLRNHPKALRHLLRALRELHTQLRIEIQMTSNDLRDYHVEKAIEDQFKLMTIGGRITGK